jgi:hypothetical protein
MPDFRARMVALRAEVIEVGRAKLHATVELSIARLQNIIATGEGSSAQVRAILAVLDRVGLTSQAPSRDTESERVLEAVVGALGKYPEAREAAVHAIEAEIVSDKDNE